MNFTPGTTYEISRNGASFAYSFITPQWDPFDAELVLVFKAVGDGTCLKVSNADMRAKRYEIKELIAA
jgi:hypothetical protein